MTPVVLAIDTATEQCSVAIQTDTQIFERVIPTARGHADMILPLIDEVLRESGRTFSTLGGLAFGRGPGSFTGVRIAVSVVQGLSLATGLPVVGISNLAAVAQRAAMERSIGRGSRLLVCMDARMQETYWAVYELQSNGLVALASDERVSSPEKVCVDPSAIVFGAGTAWRAYPELCKQFPNLTHDSDALPRAREIALLARSDISAGRGVDAASVEPVYLRDQVAWPQQK